MRRQRYTIFLIFHRILIDFHCLKQHFSILQDEFIFFYKIWGKHARLSEIFYTFAAL